MAHYLAKVGIVLTLCGALTIFCWGVFISPNGSFFCSLVALALSLINSAGLAALWIFYLSKQFSTHTVKVLDVKQSVNQRKPVVKTSFDETDEVEEQLEKFAKTATTAMFNKTKEKLTDSLF